MKKHLMWASIAIGLGAMLVSSLIAQEPKKNVPTGNWGGTGISMEVTEQGARIEFDCAHAEIVEPLALNSKGEFRAKGVLHPEHGGPVRRDEPPHNLEALYTGKLEGDILQMLILLSKGEPERGPYTLKFGESPLLRKCR